MVAQSNLERRGPVGYAAVNKIRQWFSISGGSYSQLLSATLRQAVKSPTTLSAALVLTAILIVFFPALDKSSINAGLLYSGDITGFYAPMILKTHSLIRDLQFTALDFSIYNGSSDFFLSPNFFTFHPAVLMYSAFVPEAKANIHTAGRLIIYMIVLHSFVGMFFAHRLLMRHLLLGFWPSFFGAVLFSFSIQLQSSVTQPPFFFIVTIVPWLCCALIEFQTKRDPANAVVSAIPVVLLLVGGYIPLGLTAIGLSCVVAGLASLIKPYATRSAQIKAISYSLLPVLIGSVVCAGYILSLYLFNRETGSRDAINLFYSAHQLSDTPSSLLRAFSTYLAVPGPFYEFSVSVGAVSVAIIAIFLFSPGTWTSLSGTERATLKFSTLVYLLVLLSIFGPSSPLSDMVYYFLPQAGKMHIYQRFLLFAQLALAVSVTIMLIAIHRARPQTTIRIVGLVLCMLTIMLCAVLAYSPSSLNAFGVQQVVLFELLCATILVFFLHSSSRVTVFGLAAVMVALPVVDRFYDLTQYGNTYEAQRPRLPFYLQVELRDEISAFIEANSEKPYVKYVDLTPMWTPAGVETFPKVYPYLVLNDLPLSSYTGFTFYLSSRLEYRQRMPIQNDVRLNPDWDFVRQSGADFAIIGSADFASNGLQAIGADGPDSRILRLPNDVLLVALAPDPDDAVLFDNGMLRIGGIDEPTFRPANIALNANVRSSDAASGAERVVDGNTDGDFGNGSVMHSSSDPDAWVEVDLGAIRDIGAVRVWNRTDCCKDRLDNFWLFVSDTPFADDQTAGDLMGRDGVWGQQQKAPATSSTIETSGIRGRYLRLQLPGTASADSAFLHLAELEVFEAANEKRIQAAEPVSLSGMIFKTNFANRVEAEFETTNPARIQYLFSNNPRLSFYVNGKRVVFDDSTGVPTYTVPAGRHRIEIRYSHALLTIFWCVYGLFWILAASFLLVLSGRAVRKQMLGPI